MKMKQRKQWLTFISIVVVIGIGVAYAFMTSKSQVITETEVRNQLSSLYDAEVADVQITKDVYTVVITKSGSAYLVEMNPKNGEIFSLQPTEEQPVSKQAHSTSSNISNKEKELPSSTKPKSEPDSTNEQRTSTNISKPGTAKEDKSVSQDENRSKISAGRQKQETGTVEEQVSIEGLPIDETQPATPSGETVTQPTNTEAVAPNDTKQPSSEEKKDEQISAESTKETVSDSKGAPALIGENAITIATVNESKTDESAKETQPSTMYISKKKAVRIALEQYKGSFEKLSFEKKEDGGFYLVTLKDITSEKDSKEKQKATVQIHAISGKILSVTWE